MKIKLYALLSIMLYGITFETTAQTCGAEIFTDAFNNDGSIPTEWTEFNTTGQVTVEGNQLKFDFTADQPGASRVFTPVSENVTVSFTEESTRNWAKCRLDLFSSDNKLITSVMFGNDAVKSVQYATALDASSNPTSFTGALIDGAYQKNTAYTFGVTLNFAEQTLDFFNSGALKAEGIAFLEAADDVAKISITQLSMYASEGRFFFDNIGLSYPGADRASLSEALTRVDDLTFSKVISPLYGYSSDTYSVLKTVKAQSEIIYNNCEASQSEIDATTSSLNAAITNFNNSYKNEDVLTLYASSSSLGEEANYKCGYYNGNLGTFNDKAVSFKLEKGYMLTVAQNVNGSGVSKVYIAADNALELNFPAELQNTISFMRVGPWRYTGKRGASGKSSNNDVVLSLKSDWFYDWGSADVSMTECEYVVMDWAGGAGIDKMTSFGNNMSITHHLAFNEPDGSNQANMTVDKAIEKYAILQASGLRLGAPAVTDGAKGRAWLDEFMPKAIAAGYRIDFIPVHYYKIMGATQFLAWLKDFYDMYQVPIWLTEFNYGDIWAANEKTKTEAQVLSNLQAYCQQMDAAEFVERYCIFTWQPSETSAQTVMSVRNPVTLNSVGEYYANHDAPMAYTQEVYENGPDNFVGLQSISQANSINIYPNPVSYGLVNIQLPTNVENAPFTIRLYSLSGKEVVVKNTSSNSLDVSNLDDGIYYLQLEAEGAFYTDKLLIRSNK